jgi:pyruvate/2-oxoglutarate/acetoin dehydrogenase E1 component
MTFLDALKDALQMCMRADSRVVLLGEDIAGGAGQGAPLEGAMGGTFGVTKGLFEEFGASRVLDTPISEAGITAATVGAAMAGLRPVTDLMWAAFAPKAFDEVVNQAAKMRFMSGGQTSVPMVLRMAVGGGLRAAAQHSDTHYAMFTNVPGLKVVAPATPAEARGLLMASILDDDPVVFLEHMALYTTSGPVNLADGPMRLGELGVLREGTDVTIAGVGHSALMALEAADVLKADGISAEVVSLRSLQPLDLEGLVARVGATGRFVVVEEGPARCSVASDVAAQVGEQLFGRLRAPIGRVTSNHSPVPFSPPLEDAHLPSPSKIVVAVRRSMDRG